MTVRKSVIIFLLFSNEIVRLGTITRATELNLSIEHSAFETIDGASINGDSKYYGSTMTSGISEPAIPFVDNIIERNTPVSTETVCDSVRQCVSTETVWTNTTISSSEPLQTTEETLETTAKAATTEKVTTLPTPSMISSLAETIESRELFTKVTPDTSPTFTITSIFTSTTSIATSTTTTDTTSITTSTTTTSTTSTKSSTQSAPLTEVLSTAEAIKETATTERTIVESILAAEQFTSSSTEQTTVSTETTTTEGSTLTTEQFTSSSIEQTTVSTETTTTEGSTLESTLTTEQFTSSSTEQTTVSTETTTTEGSTLESTSTTEQSTVTSSEQTTLSSESSTKSSVHTTELLSTGEETESSTTEGSTLESTSTTEQSTVTSSEQTTLSTVSSTESSAHTTELLSTSEESSLESTSPLTTTSDSTTNTTESTEVKTTEITTPAATSITQTTKTTISTTTQARPPTTTKAPAICKTCLASGSPQYPPVQTFEADFGETKTFPCPTQFKGNITSTCLRSNGVCYFQPKLPDYSNCSSAWLGDVENLEPSDAIEVIGENVASGSYTGQEMTSILDLVGKTVLKQTEETVNLPPNERIDIQQNATANANAIINSLVKESRTWEQLDSQKRVETSTHIFAAIESVAFTLANLTEETGNCTNYTYESDDSNVKFKSYAINENNLESEVLYRPQIDVEITVSGYGSAGVNCVKMVGFFLTATNLDELYPVNITDENENVYTTNTDVLGFSFPPEQGQTIFQNFSVITVLKNKHVPTYPKRSVIHNGGIGDSTFIIGSQKCVFWDKHKKTWSSDGCKLDVERTTSTQTACECNHLTPFGSIMATHKYQEWSLELDIVTTVSESMSVIALFLNFIAHGIFRLYHGEGRGNSERALIILQISFWLGLSHVIILLFMNKNQFRISEEGCIAVAILLHFSLLASFGWMLNEGVLLYRLITFVFRTSTNYKLYHIMIGYGIPIAVVGVTCIIAAATGGIHDAYSNAAQCWLNIDSGYIWAFNLPVILICTANLAVFVLVVRTRVQRTRPTTEGMQKQSQTRKSMIGFLALVFLMGLTWLFGMFTLIPAIWPLYVFGILNGLQGVFIFVFHYILDPRIVGGVKQVFLRHWKARLPSGLVLATPPGSPTRRRSSTGVDLSSRELVSSVNMNVPRPANVYKRESITRSLERSNFTWVDE